MGNKTAVITGASRGIGKAIAEEFLRRGYNLGLIARGKEELDRVCEELKGKREGSIVLGYECDVSDVEGIKKVIEDIIKKIGLDVLVNNAGVNARGSFDGDFDDRLKRWKSEMDINLTGSYICSYLAGNYMKEKGGSIINISSVKGRESTSSPGYGASKAGIMKLTIDFAKALAPSVRVNCVAPGFIDCGMTSELPDDKKKMYMGRIPMGRFGSVEEVARVVGFLSSDDASYITGSVIEVGGGYFI